jgi:Polysaccharide deacetylase
MDNRLAVLGRHNIEDTWCFLARERHGTERMARQPCALARAANVVPVGPALEQLTLGKGLPHRVVAITFHDGYRDTLDLAVPTLERLGLPATFFPAPGLPPGAVTPWDDARDLVRRASRSAPTRCTTPSWPRKEPAGATTPAPLPPPAGRATCMASRPAPAGTPLPAWRSNSAVVLKP